MSDLKAPIVSVIMPTYNRSGLLRRAIASVLTQSFDDFELIVVNDASTDDTKKVIDEIAATDSRVRAIHHEKNYYPDISRTLNEAMESARGSYIARLDDDDYWCDLEKLAKQVRFLDEHLDCAVVGGGTIVIDENDRERFRYEKPQTDDAIRAVALAANPFTHSTVMFRKDLAREVGGYGRYSNAEDWDLWLRMGTHGTFYNFPDYFVRYTMTAANKTALFRRSQGREVLRVITAHRAEYPHFFRAWLVNAAQYCYGFLPKFIQRRLNSSLARLKRSAF